MYPIALCSPDGIGVVVARMIKGAFSQRIATLPIEFSAFIMYALSTTTVPNLSTKLPGYARSGMAYSILYFSSDIGRLP